MKKILSAIAAAIFISLSLVTAGSVSAQSNEPQEINVQPSEVKLVEPTSGFVDDEGNPISIEEWNKIRDEESKPKWWAIIAVIAVVGGVAVSIIAVSKNRKSKE